MTPGALLTFLQALQNAADNSPVVSSTIPALGASIPVHAGDEVPETDCSGSHENPKTPATRIASCL